MFVVLSVALPVFALIVVGTAIGRLGLLGAGATAALNHFVIYLALPAVLFQAMTRIERAEIFDPGYFTAFVGAIVAAFAVSLLLSRIAGVQLADATVQALVATFNNTGYMGIPICLIAFGPESLAPAVIAMVFTSCLHLGGALALLEVAVQPAPQPWATGRKVLGVLVRNPLLAAPLLGLVYGQTGQEMGFGLPAVADRFLTLLGAAATPCALVAIGLQLAEPGQRFRKPVVARLVAIKLLMQPAIAYAIAFHLVSLPPVWAATAVVMSALPTGTSAVLMAQAYGREAATGSGTVLVSTILSFVTLSVLLAWIAPP